MFLQLLSCTTILNTCIFIVSYFVFNIVSFYILQKLRSFNNSDIFILLEVLPFTCILQYQFIQFGKIEMKSNQYVVEQDSQYYHQIAPTSEIKKGPWQEFQDRIYQEFIQQHEEFFECQFYRRSNQVFKVLSQILKNARTPQQCKSHHQRMKQMTENGSIQEIITYLDKKYQKKQKKILKKNLQENQNIQKSKQKETNILSEGKQEKVCNGHQIQIIGVSALKIHLNLDLFLEW